MEVISYNQALKIYMEVFDYLMKNNLFILDDNLDFTQSRIIITEQGFLRENKEYNDTWDNLKKVDLVTVGEVLEILAINIDRLLAKYQIPFSSGNGYAYLPMGKEKISKKYYHSYQEIALIFKKIAMLDYDRSYEERLQIAFYKKQEEAKLPKKIEDFTRLEIKMIELYALLEEELNKRTKSLFWNEEEQYTVQFQNKVGYIHWNDMRESILYNAPKKVK